MMRTLALHLEKGLLAATALLLGGVALTWAQRTRAGVDQLRRESADVVLLGETLPNAVTMREASPFVWERPSAQSEGGGWVYEVFTPPEIYYHASVRSFVVTPPHYAAEAADPVFGLELLAVRRAPYRLQLAGYFGGPEDYLAAFVGRGSPQTLLARTGHRFEALDLTLKSFAVRKVAVPAEDLPGTMYDVAAFAVLHDARTGVEVVLDSRKPLLTDTPLAIFQVPGGQGRAHELQEGDTFSDTAATYRVERIQLSPPEVVVARLAPGVPVPERRLLRPADDADGGLASREHRGAGGPSTRLRGVAANDR